MRRNKEEQAKESMGQAIKVQRILTGALILLTLILIAGMWYSNKLLNSKVDEVATTKAIADSEDDKYAALLNTQAKLGQLSDLPGLAKQALPISDNQSLDIAELNKFAGDYGVNITSIIFSDASKSKGKTTSITKLPGGVDLASLSIQAEDMNYDQLLGFLRAIESSRHLMQPTNINITPDDAGGISKLTLGVNVYYMQ